MSNSFKRENAFRRCNIYTTIIDHSTQLMQKWVWTTLIATQTNKKAALLFRIVLFVCLSQLTTYYMSSPELEQKCYDYHIFQFFFVVVVALFLCEEEEKKQLNSFCNTKNMLNNFILCRFFCSSNFCPFALFYISICRFVFFSSSFDKLWFDIELTIRISWHFCMDWITSYFHHVANLQCYQHQLLNFPVSDWFLWPCFERLAWFHFPKVFAFFANALLYAQHCCPIAAGSPPTENDDFQAFWKREVDTCENEWMSRQTINIHRRWICKSKAFDSAWAVHQFKVKPKSIDGKMIGTSGNCLFAHWFFSSLFLNLHHLFGDHCDIGRLVHPNKSHFL